MKAATATRTPGARSEPPEQAAAAPAETAAIMRKIVADMKRRRPAKPGEKTGPQILRELRDGT